MGSHGFKRDEVQTHIFETEARSDFRSTSDLQDLTKADQELHRAQGLAFENPTLGLHGGDVAAADLPLEVLESSVSQMGRSVRISLSLSLLCFALGQGERAVLPARLSSPVHHPHEARHS